MAEKNINILDGNKDHIEIISSFLQENESSIYSFASIPVFMTGVDRSVPSLTLTDYHTILQSERDQVIAFFREIKTQNIIVYNVPQNANKRLAFYDLGAWRVFDTSTSLEEVCQSVKWLLARLVRQEESLDLYSKGRLEDLPLPLILRMLATEDRTGILKVNSGKNSGRIYFWQGQLDSVQVGTHEGLKALLHVMMWEHGRFAFTVSGRAKSERVITLSVPGLFIISREIKQKFENDLAQLGGGNAVLRLKNQGDLPMSPFKLHPEFVRYLSRPHLLSEVLENPFYTNYETADLLLKLFQSDFLLLKQPAEQMVEESIQELVERDSALLHVDFTEEEIQTIANNLNLQETENSKVVMLSPEQEIQVQLLSQLGSRDSHVFNEKGFKVTQLQFDDQIRFYLVGLKMNQAALEIIEGLAQNLAGYIFLLSIKDKKQYEYANYLIGQALKLAPAPAVIAVSDVTDERELEEIRSHFYLSQPVPWIVFDVNSMSDIKNIFLGIKKIEPEKEDSRKETQEEEA